MKKLRNKKSWFWGFLPVMGMITFLAVCPYLCEHNFSTAAVEHNCCPNPEPVSDNHCADHKQPFIKASTNQLSEMVKAFGVALPPAMTVAALTQPLLGQTITTTGPPGMYQPVPIYLAQLSLRN